MLLEFLEHSMEFNGILWNFLVANPNITEFRRIAWNFEGAIPNATTVILNSMEYSMEYAMEFRVSLEQRIQMWPSSIEFIWRSAFFCSKLHLSSIGLQGSFHYLHGYHVSPRTNNSNRKFLGTWLYLRGCIRNYRKDPWNIPGNSMELWEL